MNPKTKIAISFFVYIALHFTLLTVTYHSIEVFQMNFWLFILNFITVGSVAGAVASFIYAILNKASEKRHVEKNRNVIATYYGN